MIAPGSLFGYIPLDPFGITPTPIGDEQSLNFNVPAFQFAGQTYTRIGVIVERVLDRGRQSRREDDVQFPPQTLPDPARPNNVLAPYWTDLDGTGAPGVYAALPDRRGGNLDRRWSGG